MIYKYVFQFNLLYFLLILQSLYYKLDECFVKHPNAVHKQHELLVVYYFNCFPPHYADLTFWHSSAMGRHPVCRISTLQVHQFQIIISSLMGAAEKYSTIYSTFLSFGEHPVVLFLFQICFCNF